MGKQEDLKLVFDFIAEYLKNDESKNETSKDNDNSGSQKKLLVETPHVDSQMDILSELKKPLDNIGGDANYIKNLMDRVESKSIEQATLKSALATQRKEFDSEIKRLKEEIVKDFMNQKISEENVTVSGTTDSSTNEDILESYQ